MVINIKLFLYLMTAYKKLFDAPLYAVTITTSSLDPNGINKMINLFKNVFWYTIEGTCAVLLYILKYIPGTQEEFNEEVRREPILLMYVPDHFKTQEMCEEAVKKKSWLLHHVPPCFRTQEMCEKLSKIITP